MKLQRILCPTDFSRSAALAQRLAAQTAREQGAELFLYHAVPTHSQDTKGLGELLEEYLAEAEAQSQRRLGRDAAELGSDIAVKRVVERSVNAFNGILAQALSFRPDLMVVATHAGTNGNQSFLGTVSGNVIRHAPCSVWTVRPGARIPEGPSPRKILVPIDFSDGARRAVEVASALSREQDTLLALHVLHNRLTARTTRVPPFTSSRWTSPFPRSCRSRSRSGSKERLARSRSARGRSRPPSSTSPGGETPT